MNIVYKPIEEIQEYANNPRHNESAVPYVAESIKRFGFKVPILLDAQGVIIAGHTRLKAARELGMVEIPCIIADDLTEEEARAFRIADNKVSELSEWDMEKLADELAELDMDWESFGFSDSDDEELFADAPELAKVYKEPDAANLQCPKCGHVDSSVRFKKV